MSKQQTCNPSTGITWASSAHILKVKCDTRALVTKRSCCMFIHDKQGVPNTALIVSLLKRVRSRASYQLQPGKPQSGHRQGVWAGWPYIPGGSQLMAVGCFKQVMLQKKWPSWRVMQRVTVLKSDAKVTVLKSDALHSWPPLNQDHEECSNVMIVAVSTASGVNTQHNTIGLLCLRLLPFLWQGPYFLRVWGKALVRARVLREHSGRRIRGAFNHYS